MKKGTRIFDVLILLIGILFVALGVYLFLIGPDHNPSGSGLVKASTSVQFGADFYTTSAQYTGLAANALVDLFNLVRYALSACFVLTGLLIDCLAGKALVKSKNEKAKQLSQLQQHAEPVIPAYPTAVFHNANETKQ